MKLLNPDDAMISISGLLRCPSETRRNVRKRQEIRVMKGKWLPSSGPTDGNSHVLHFFNGCNSKVYKRGNGATIDLCLSINMRVDQCKNKSAEKCALPQMAPSDLPLWNIANKSMKRNTLSAERMVNTRPAIHFGMNCWCFIHRVRRGLIGE